MSHKTESRSIVSKLGNGKGESLLSFIAIPPKREEKRHEREQTKITNPADIDDQR